VTLVIHPAAAAEAQAARVHYAQIDKAVGARFLAEYDRAIERIREAPSRWPMYPHAVGEQRWCRFRRFPYSVIYELLPSATHVLAVAADRRRPGYWQGRRKP
jgi:hypothetical protein